MSQLTNILMRASLRILKTRHLQLDWRPSTHVLITMYAKCQIPSQAGNDKVFLKKYMLTLFSLLFSLLTLSSTHAQQTPSLDSLQDLYLRTYQSQNLSVTDREELIQRICQHEGTDCDYVIQDCLDQLANPEDQIICYPNRYQLWQLFDQPHFYLSHPDIYDEKLEKFLTKNQRALADTEMPPFQKTTTIINQTCQDSNLDCQVDQACGDTLQKKEHTVLCAPQKYQLYLIHGSTNSSGKSRLTNERNRKQLEFIAAEELRLLDLERSLIRTAQQTVFLDGSSGGVNAPFDLTDQTARIGDILLGEKHITLNPSFTNLESDDNPADYNTEPEPWQDMRPKNLPDQSSEFNTDNGESSLAEVLWMTTKIFNELNSYPLTAAQVPKNMWEPSHDTKPLGTPTIGANGIEVPAVTSDNPAAITAQQQKITDDLDAILQSIVTESECGEVQLEEINQASNRRNVKQLLSHYCDEIKAYSLQSKLADLKRLTTQDTLAREQNQLSLTLENWQGFLDFMVTSTEQRLVVWRKLLSKPAR